MNKTGKRNAPGKFDMLKIVHANCFEMLHAQSKVCENNLPRYLNVTVSPRC
jgi:hypothetical protein